MGKVRRLAIALRRRDFIVAAGSTFVAILGIASALLTIAGRHFELVAASVLVMVALACSCLIHLRPLAARQVAVDDVIASDIYDDPSALMRCPCALKLAGEAKRLAEHCFSGSVTIGPDTFEQFRVKNPLILACLTNRTGRFLGYFDAIPLSTPFAESFLNGTVTETQITHEDVLAVDQMAACRYLFVSGFAVVEPDSHAGKRNASILTWALLHYLEAYYASTKPLLFALAATQSGDHLMKRFRLDLRSKGADRRDRYRLYAITLTSEEIARRLAVMPDWQEICRLDWAPIADQNGSGGGPALPQKRIWDLAPGATLP